MQLFRLVFRYSLLRGAVSALSMVSTVFIYRLMGPTEIGKWVLVLGLVQSIAPLMSFGTANALQRFVVGVSRHQAIRFYRRALIVTLCGVGLVFILLNVPILQSLLSEEIQHVLWGVLVAIGLYAIHVLNGFMLCGLGKLNAATLLDGIGDNGSRLVMLFFLVLGMGTYQTLLLVQIMFYVITVISGSLLIVRVVFRVLPEDLVERSSQKTERGYLHYASQAWFGGLLLYVGGYFTLVAVRYFLSAHDLGLYSAATKIPTVLQSLLLLPLGTPLLYHFTGERNLSRSVGQVKRGIGLVAMLIGPVSIIICGTAKWALPFLYGQEYKGAVLAYQVYAFHPVVMVLPVLLNAFSMSLNRAHLPNLTAVVVISILLISYPLMLPLLGIVGASFLTVVANILSANFFYAFLLRKEIPGLPGITFKLWLAFLPWAFLAFTQFWWIGILGFPVTLIGLKVITLEDVRGLWRNVLLLPASILKRARV